MCTHLQHALGGSLVANTVARLLQAGDGLVALLRALGMERLDTQISIASAIAALLVQRLR